MGKADWQSPPFRLLVHLYEHSEPLPYAFAVIKDPMLARTWIKGLVTTGLLECSRDDATLHANELIELLRAIEGASSKTGADVLMRLSPTCRAAMEANNQGAFVRAWSFTSETPSSK